MLTQILDMDTFLLIHMIKITIVISWIRVHSVQYTELDFIKYKIYANNAHNYIADDTNI